MISLYEKTMTRVWLRLEALAQQYGVGEELRQFAAMERSGSHPLTFADVASALQSESPAEGVKTPPLHDQQAASIAQAIQQLAESHSRDDHDAGAHAGA